MQRLETGSVVHKAFGVVSAEPLADRQIRVAVSTGQVDRAGDIVVQKGIIVDNYKLSRTILFNHNPDLAVAQCVDIAITDDCLEATAQFPEPGVSAKADEVYGLLKAGVINSASIGFMPLDVEPVDGKNPRKGLRINASELLEFSFVSVPANPGAQVLQRAYAAQERRAEGRGNAKLPLTPKSLYAVAMLAELLQMLGYLVESAEAERAREGDESEVPDQLRQALNELGAALTTMTSEEVAELLSGRDSDNGCDVVYLMQAVRGTSKGALLAGTPLAKAGRVFSQATETAMRGHLATIAQGHAEMVKMLDDACGDRDDGDADDDDEDENDDEMTKARAHRLRQVETLRLAG